MFHERVSDPRPFVPSLLPHELPVNWVNSSIHYVIRYVITIRE